MPTWGWGENEPQIKPPAEGGDRISTFAQKVKNLFADTFDKLNGCIWNNATQNSAGYMSADDKKKLDSVATGAEVNQAAFAHFKVGNVTVSADTKQDTLTLVAGNAITLTPDAANDTVTVTHNAYTARTGQPTANLKPGFGDTITVTQIVTDATGHVTAANNRTITIPATAASVSAAGLVTTGEQTFAGAKTFTGTVHSTLGGSNTSGVVNQFGGAMAVNDQWAIRAGATANDAGFLEISTGDNGNEPIYVSQYTGSNYATLKKRAALLDSSGNTSFPGTVTVGGLKVGTATVGGTAKPIYMNAGTLTVYR